MKLRKVCPVVVATEEGSVAGALCVLLLSQCEVATKIIWLKCARSSCSSSKGSAAQDFERGRVREIAERLTEFDELQRMHRASGDWYCSFEKYVSTHLQDEVSAVHLPNVSIESAAVDQIHRRLDVESAGISEHFAFAVVVSTHCRSAFDGVQLCLNPVHIDEFCDLAEALFDYGDNVKRLKTENDLHNALNLWDARRQAKIMRKQSRTGFCIVTAVLVAVGAGGTLWWLARKWRAK